MYHHYKLEKYIPKALIPSYSCQNSVFFAEKNPLDTSTIKFNLHTGCLSQWRSTCPRCKDHPTPPSMSTFVSIHFQLPSLRAPGPGHPPSPSAASGRSNLASLCCPSATFTATARQMAPSFLSKERTPASRVYLPSEKRYFNFG